MLAEFREFLESAIGKAKVNFAMAERLSDQLRGEVGAHGSPLEFVSKSTLHEHVRGKRRQNLPPWSWVTNLWAFLVAAASENKVDPARLGALEEWQTVYEETETKLRLIDRSIEPAVPASLPVPGIAPHTTWWASYADIVPPWFQRYLNLEPLCADIRCYENLYIPGLLQTEEYADAVVRLQHGGAPETEIARRVGLRMLRQQLEPHGGRRMWTLLNELALWNPLLDPAGMKRQLRRLLDAPPHTPIQIVPANAPACQPTSGPITILRFSHEGIPDTVYLEQTDDALYPDDPRMRAEYVKQFNSLAITAYCPNESRRLIEEQIDRA